jgi:transcriptional regulator with XRE-family HTH domain
MAKGSHILILPFEATSSLQALGAHLSRARRARGDTQDVAGQRCGLHKQTVARIERGDPSVGIGKVFALMVMYDMAPRLFALGDMDEVTEQLMRRRLPKRGRSVERSSSSPGGLQS